MKIIKNNKDIIFTAIICAIFFTGVGVYAETRLLSKDVEYSNSKTTKTNVEDAINELYEMKKDLTVSVGTITTPGQSYTFTRDGIITGTIATKDGKSAIIYFDSSTDANIRSQSSPTSSLVYRQSIYVPKGTTILTHSTNGLYNLELYEFWR